MQGQLTRYAYINAKLRARISKLLPEETFKRMVSAHSLGEALGILRETSYGVLGDIFEKTGDLKLGELELFRREVELFTELQKYVQGELLEFVQALSARYEIDNLKNALRLFFDRRVRKRPVDYAVHYVYREPIRYNFSVEGIINAESVDEITRYLAATPYASIVSEYRASVEEGSLFPLEVALDFFFYRNLLACAQALPLMDRRVALRIIGVEIDLQNIDWIIRFKTFYGLPLEKALALIIPSGFNLKEKEIREVYSTQNLGELIREIVGRGYSGIAPLLSTEATDTASRFLLVERVLEHIMASEVQRVLAGYPFTVGIVLAYFLLKRNEMRKVRSVLNAKYYKLSEGRLQGIL